MFYGGPIAVPLGAGGAGAGRYLGPVLAVPAVLAVPGVPAAPGAPRGGPPGAEPPHEGQRAHLALPAA